MQLDKKEIEEQINRKIEIGTKQFGKDFKFLVIDILSLEKMLNPDSAEKKQSRIIPLAKWNDFHPYPSVRALRQYNVNKDENGFSACLEYGGENGGRILINEDKFFEWQAERKKLRNIK